MLATGLRQRIQLFSLMAGMMILTAGSVLMSGPTFQFLSRGKDLYYPLVGVPLNMPAESSCGSAHTQLKKDLLLQHHNLVKMLAALGIDACKEYRMHSTPAVLSCIRQGNKACVICQHICSSTQALKVHIRGQHMEDPSLQCDECDYTAGDKHGLDLHRHSHCLQRPDFNVISAPKVTVKKWHLK